MNGLTIHHGKMARKTFSSDGGAGEGKACFPATDELIKKSDEDMRELLLKLSPGCVATSAMRLVLRRRLVRPDLRVLADGNMGPRLANSGIK